jgi:hypothetical protein
MTGAERHERAVANTLGFAREAAARGDFAGRLSGWGWLRSSIVLCRGRGPTRRRRSCAITRCSWCCRTHAWERTLVGAGEREAVLDLRRRWQRVMRESCSEKIAGLTGRKVVGFMSDNYIDPDIAVEVFILEPLGADPAVQAAIAVAEPAGG